MSCLPVVEFLMKKVVLAKIEKQVNEDFSDGIFEAGELYNKVKGGEKITWEDRKRVVTAFMFSMTNADATEILIQMRRARQGF